MSVQCAGLRTEAGRSSSKDTTSADARVRVGRPGDPGRDGDTHTTCHGDGIVLLDTFSQNSRIDRRQALGRSLDGLETTPAHFLDGAVFVAVKSDNTGFVSMPSYAPVWLSVKEDSLNRPIGRQPCTPAAPSRRKFAATVRRVQARRPSAYW